MKGNASIHVYQTTVEPGVPEIMPSPPEPSTPPLPGYENVYICPYDGMEFKTDEEATLHIITEHGREIAEKSKMYNELVKKLGWEKVRAVVTVEGGLKPSPPTGYDDYGTDTIDVGVSVQRREIQYADTYPDRVKT